MMRLRDDLVPLNRKYPLRRTDGRLHAATSNVAPRDFITFEYCMLDGVNDIRPARRCRTGRDVWSRPDVPCKFNLIPFNPFPESGLVRSCPTHQGIRGVLRCWYRDDDPQDAR